MPPPVRKTANNSGSGVGIIRSSRNRPAFSSSVLKIEEILSVFCCSKEVSATVVRPIRALMNQQNHK
jgi:23S rRNA C2498 (ribose-2'-O)-methylase RlmM